MKVGNLILFRDNDYGHHRLWEVLSVCLGGAGQEGLVELKCLNYNAGQDTNGKQHTTTWVPEPILRNLEIFTKEQK